MSRMLSLWIARARSGSINPNSGSIIDTSPVTRPSQMHFPSTSPIDETTPFPMLSDTEEAEMDRARSSGFRHDHDGSDDEHRYLPAHAEVGEGSDHEHRGGASIGESSGYDSHARLIRRDSDGGPGSGIRNELRRHEGEMAMRGGGDGKNRFDFGAMDDFARKESGSGWFGDGEGEVDVAASAEDPEVVGRDMERTNTMSAYGDDAAFSPRESELGAEGRHHFHRRRQRKLSQSNPVLRRQGKLAIFEGFGSNGAGAEAPSDNGTSTAFKAPRQPKALGVNGDTPGFTTFTDAAPGHDRPYRFSFYSNALPVTIHARTLAELPANGQSFEDLFKGKGGVGDDPSGNATAEGTEYGSITGGLDTPEKQQMRQKAAKGLIPSGGFPQPSSTEEDTEGFTWWLDVLSPTDEEMRMLSRVFGIHPLTTEDILLEETREKIELFRNYYLVCFRSFDQDPYSQTYLEPLNMYIIVFREGTLSFHFRGTPHPQNVRRRIKHLKDYISVTSDWISYALIDDITDAFGPLIQSIEYEVDSIDELVLILKEAEQSDMLRRIGTCRKKVMGLLRLMGNKADVVKGLAKRCNEQWLVAPKSDIGLYLSDIQDHLITMTQNLNHYEKILSRSHSNYLAQISIEMTDANNQINDVLSKLTALGTVLM
ncbi:hypothetical protein BCR39DRAFT_512376 [Naematelia encephala]|uniref:Cora-domain-containing protein n=1 Tax=Naematelia encephala TaxID=71784 RepID=A0A1Y2BM27_9TREE|nr:hypothetical protein BCR39DRAFT_512376 [Naematelia encephala]